MALRRIFLTALLAGVLAGLVAGAVTQLRIAPLIAQAETYEAAAMTEHGHGMPAVEWEPSPGLERAGFSVLADLLAGIGFGFILTGAIALAGRPIDARRGLMWGAAGFAAFVLAPGLGLAPALPGMPEADLAARQGWWIGTALATALGLAVAVFGRGWIYRLIGAALILLPQAIGAPSSSGHGAAVPAELAARFAVASLTVAALFWLLLGGLAGWLYRRFENA